MTEGKNFSGQATPSIIDTEYRHCNFAQQAPVNVAGKMRGVRLFPGDDTPRTFIKCNMMNCEPPPGSTVDDCLTCIKEVGKVTSTDTITIDGVSESVDHHSHFVHGRFDPATGGYIDLPTPTRIEVD